MARLRFEAVSHRYDDGPWVLRELDLDVADGEAHALLGPSGAGKSTLLNLLSGLRAPTAGRILLDDADVTHQPPRQRNIAQVFQFPVVYDGLTVRGNLEFPLRNQGMAGAPLRARVDAVAELMELTDVLGAHAAELLAYDRQKAAMARALVRPDVAAVLLDEPLTAVEPAAKWRLRRALKTVQRELRLTMIYVTHDQLEALSFADRVSVMAEGRILQSAPPAGLFEDPQHAFVGHFIGSPGMNLLPASISDGVARLNEGHGVTLGAGFSAGACELGFRPEDGIASNAGPTDRDGDPLRLPVKILEVRTLGVRAGRGWGLVQAELAGTRIHLRQDTDGLAPGGGELLLPRQRLRVFREGWRLREAEAMA
ncbi:MAG: ABC transporter ATP-binding protein [Pseudomonadales bacterium]|jgi:glycerol transport system ATP-binding protein|nr:ABC transporter ATP-binding protein [Pseudomonadales bacterium]